MAFPTIVGVGTAAGGTGAVVPGLPTGWAANDLHILVTNTKRAEAQLTITGFTLVGAAIPTADNKVSVFKRDAQVGDVAPSVPDSGDHTYAVIIGFRNPGGGTCSVDATFATAVASVASTAVAWPSLTTAGADRLILHALADGADATGARFSGQTNAGLTNLAEQFDNGITSNGGGGLVLVTGEKATAGATGSTTGTLVSATQALMTIVIEAPGGAGTQTIDGALYTNTNTFNAATITQTGPDQTITGALFNDPDTFYASSVVPGVRTVVGALYTNSHTFYAATVSPGAVNISGNLFTNPNTFYSATIQQTVPSDQFITGQVFANSNSFYAATISGGAVITPTPSAGGGSAFFPAVFESRPMARDEKNIRRILDVLEKPKRRKRRVQEIAKIVAEVTGVESEAAKAATIEAVQKADAMSAGEKQAQLEADYTNIVMALLLQAEMLQDEEDIELLLLAG